MNTFLLIYLITYPICAVVCAGLFYAYIQRGYPSTAEEYRLEASGEALLIGVFGALLGLPGVFVMFCRCACAKHGFKLPFTR